MLKLPRGCAATGAGLASVTAMKSQSARTIRCLTMKLKAVVDILQSRLHKRGVPLKALTYGEVEQGSGGTLRQKIGLQQGIPIERAKEIVRMIKDSKVRVQASIQEDQVRVAGKNRDDLQKIIAMLKDKDLGIALQFTNYRST